MTVVVIKCNAIHTFILFYFNNYFDNIHIKVIAKSLKIKLYFTRGKYQVIFKRKNSFYKVLN